VARKSGDNDITGEMVVVSLVVSRLKQRWGGALW
jgi:hypothetical protein